MKASDFLYPLRQGVHHFVGGQVYEACEVRVTRNPACWWYYCSRRLRLVASLLIEQCWLRWHHHPNADYHSATEPSFNRQIGLCQAIGTSAAF